MNEISDSAIMTALGRQMNRAVAKQAVAAGNLANIDTPGFRAREASFGELLDGEIRKLDLTTTHARQLPGLGDNGPANREVQGLQAGVTANNVQLDHELLMMTRAPGESAAAQAALSGEAPPHPVCHQRGTVMSALNAGITASASALNAERARIEVAVSNLANDAVTGPDNGGNPQAAASARADALDRDAFLRLLLVQLQHQDPPSPQSNEEFIAQLAQFSALEQLTSINEAVSEMAQSLSAFTGGLHQPAEDQPAVEGK